MAEFDALTEGIGLGGLRNRTDIKLLLCYCLKSTGCPTSKTGLNELLQNEALVNFFEANNALSELLEAGHITEETGEDDVYYTLTDSGREIAETLETELPRSLRETAVRAAMLTAAAENRKKAVKADMERCGTGYNVTLKIRNGDETLLALTLYAADSLQADAISRRFLANPERFYMHVVGVLTD